MNSALLQLERRLVPNLYLMLKCNVALREVYHITLIELVYLFTTAHLQELKIITRAWFFIT